MFLFYRSLFPDEFSKKIIRVFIGYGAAYCIIIFPFLKEFFATDWYLPLDQSVIFISCIYLFWALFRAVLNRRPGALIMFLGPALFGILLILDVYNFSLTTNWPGHFPVFNLALLICQSIVIGMRFSRSQKENILHREQLAHAEKLATIGTLVAGVAHEINNPNASIKLNADLLQKSWGKLEPILDEYARDHGAYEIGDMPLDEFKGAVTEALGSTTRNVERIRKLVDDLRTFARKDEGNFNEDVDVNAVVKEAISMLGATLRKATTHLEVSYASNLPCIKGNTLRLEQVVVNLLNNARQALTGDNQGIFVSTALDPARHIVTITVRDEGCGMDKKTLERIREPFFTTKGPAEGTGLGLSICNEIVKKHGGELKIESELGKETSVSIFLPVGGAKNSDV
jgi:signal transduction histidine kinase